MDPERRYRDHGGSGGQHEAGDDTCTAVRAGPVDKTWYVDDLALMQSGESALDAFRHMANMTGLMDYFLGLELRAN